MITNGVNCKDRVEDEAKDGVTNRVEDGVRVRILSPGGHDGCHNLPISVIRGLFEQWLDRGFEKGRIRVRVRVVAMAMASCMVRARPREAHDAYYIPEGLVFTTSLLVLDFDFMLPILMSQLKP